jgi:hypothetical protein
MAASVQQVARQWAKHGLGNAKFSASLAQQYNALMAQSITPGGLDRVTTATKNGVSMAKSVGLSVPDAMTAMGMAIDWIEAGVVPSQSRSIGRFF